MWIRSSLCWWMPWPHEVPCHPRWQCRSPNGFISVEASVCSCAHSCVNGLSMLMCSGKHWSVSSIHVNLILTVPVDHPNRQCFDKVSVSVCTLEDIVVPVLFVWVWSSLCLLMSCLHGCQAICRHSADHPNRQCFVLIRSQYRYVLWKTLWFLSYLFECDLHCACWCPAPVDARPSADTVWSPK